MGCVVTLRIWAPTNPIAGHRCRPYTLNRNCRMPSLHKGVLSPCVDPSPDYRSIGRLRIHLLRRLDLQLADRQRRVSVLRTDPLRATSALLLLDLDSHGFQLGAGDDGAALEETFIDVWCALEGEVARSEHRGAVETQNVARDNAGHAEGEADVVTGLNEVRAAVDVDGDVVGGLGGEEGEQVANGVGDGASRGRLGRVE